MKTRAIITTIVSFVLLVAVVAAGLNAIFTITLVESEFSVCSEAGKRDAEALKAELDKFVGDSTTFLDVDDVNETVEKYPCFRVEAVEKSFPKTLKVKVSERKEFFAVKNGENYAVLDEEGIYLYDGANTNRLGGVNVVLEGFDIALEKGSRATGEYIDEALTMFSVFSELLPGVRANVVSLRLAHNIGQNTKENTFFVVTMREGVKIAIANPAENIALKARAAFTDETYGYLSPNFSDREKMYGSITVSGNDANVDRRDDLPIKEA